MRILFLEVDTERAWALASMGPAFLAAYLRRAGHRVDFFRARVDLSDAEVVAEVLSRAPDVLGLSLTTRQWLRGKRLAEAVKDAMDVHVIAGGLHPTFAPQEVLESPGFDSVCVGEGEEALLDLVQALECDRAPTGIENIWVRGGTHPGMRPPITPLEALPYLARDLLDEPPGVIHLATQRGCPFPCTYCAARMYDQLYGENAAQYGRRRSVDDVLEELDVLRQERDVSYVIFLDDTFTIHRPWVQEFCDRYGDEFGFPFSIHARVETVNPKLIRSLQEAGCRHIVYGVESGSFRVRKEIMKRHATNARIQEVFEATKEAGLMATANCMLGLPGERYEEVQETIALIKSLAPDDFGYFVFYPYQGTELFKVCRERGYLPENYLELPARHDQSILKLPDLSQAQISKLYDQFTTVRTQLWAEHGTEHVHVNAAAG